MGPAEAYGNGVLGVALLRGGTQVPMVRRMF